MRSSGAVVPRRQAAAAGQGTAFTSVVGPPYYGSTHYGTTYDALLTMSTSVVGPTYYGTTYYGTTHYGTTYDALLTMSTSVVYRSEERPRLANLTARHLCTPAWYASALK